jgi:two-component system, cell cycle sensor histidine kinase and response regulator CckA
VSHDRIANGASEILRQASIVLRGRPVTLWEVADADRFEARLSAAAAAPPPAATMAERLGRWHVPTPRGSRWISCVADKDEWIIAPVRDHPPQPPPDGVERRRPERFVLELAGTCLGMRDRADDEARRSEARLRTLFDNAWEAVALLDASGQMLFLSRAASHVLDQEVARLLGSNALDFIHPDDLPMARAVFERIATLPGAPVSVELRARGRDGAYRTVQAVGVNRLDDPDMQAIVVNYRDVTDRRGVEEALRESEELYRIATETATDGIITIDEHSRMLFINPAATEIFGYTADELLGRSLTTLMPERLRHRHLAALHRYLGSAQRTMPWRAFNLTGQRKDGREIDIELSLSEFQRGESRLFTGFLRDVTARRRAERVQGTLYRISEAANQASSLDGLLGAVHRIIADLMPATSFYVALYDKAADLFTYPYHADERAADYSPRRPGRGVTAYVLRTGRPLLVTPAVHQDLLRRGEIVASDASSIDWLGVPMTLDMETIGVVAVQGYDPRVSHSQDDITILQFVSTQIAQAIERKRSEERLKDSESRYRLLFEASPEAMYVFDVATLGILAVNDAAIARYGYTRAEFLAMNIRDINPPEEWEELDRVVRERTPGPQYRTGVRQRRKDGTQMDVELTAHDILFDGRIASLVLARDVTEQRRMADQLRQAQKMEAIGQLAGGVSHDFNNILTVILASADTAMLHLPPDHPSHDDVVEIREAALRASELTRQLLAFSRRQVMLPQVLDLHQLVGNLQRMLRRLIREDVELRIEAAAPHPIVRADPAQLEQVLINLVVNARDAMPSGGQLSIRTDNLELGEPEPGQPIAVPAGSYVLLTVSDTGTGMDERTLARIFDPFFTTKAAGSGTGLGLATVYGIVKQSGGWIWARSEPGAGTVFSVYLPRSRETAQPLRVSVAMHAPVSGTETVLLVEDDLAVQGVTRGILESHGYTVLVAADGTDAIEVAQRHEGPIHLLLTDVVMPRMGGHELVERLAVLRPDAQVVFSSAHPDDDVVRDLATARALYLPKPFTMEALLGKVREALDR